VKIAWIYTSTAYVLAVHCWMKL